MSHELEVSFGNLLIKKGYATVAQVKECLALQAKSPRDSKGRPVKLADVMIRKGYITMEAVEEIFREQTGAAGTTPHTPSSDSHGLTPKTVSFKEVPAEAKAATLDPKRRLGKFALISEIGRGGMGQVFKAWDTALNRLVAVKVLTSDTAPEDIKRFFREAQTAASLTHPNIAAVYDVGEQDGKYYIAMQYIDGRTLAGAKLPPKLAAEILQTVCEAIEYAHRQKLVHRDIKPQNIMLDKHGTAYVLDFGLAKSSKGRSDVTQQGTVMGTPSYMAPEQAQGKAMTVRNDVYSLGATLYELVTGRPPFKGPTPLDTVMQVLTKEAVPPSQINHHVPLDLELVIQKCLEKDPKLRYPSAHALAEECGRFVRGEALSTQPPSLVMKLSKSLRRNKALVPALAGLGLAAAAIVVFLVMSSSGHSEQVRATLYRANEVFEKGKYDEAKALYNQVLALDGSNPTAKERLKVCTDTLDAEKKKYEREKAEAERKQREAEEAAKRRASAGPEVARGKELLDEAMRDLYRPGADLEISRAKAGQAIERFDAALKAAPDLADAYYYRGRAHQFRLDWAKAEADWGEALKRDAAYAPALIERGRLRMRRYSEAFVDAGGGGYLKENEKANELKRLATADFAAAAKSASSEQQDAAEAMMRLSEGNASAAVDLAERALKKRATDEELWKVLGDAYYFSANVDVYHRSTGSQTLNLGKGIEAYSKAIELRTNFPEARAMRAYILEVLGRVDEALADIEVALKIDRRNYIALAIGASILGRTGGGPDPDRAIQLYGEAIDVKPDAYFCRVNRSVLLVAKGRMSEAKADLDKAVELNPKHMFGLQLKGALLGRMGNEKITSDPEGARKTFLEGIEHLSKALELAPDFPTTWYNRGALRASLGRVLLNLGKQDEGTNAYREAVGDMEESIRRGHPNPDGVRAVIRSITGG